MRTQVPSKNAWVLLNHGPTTLISTAHGGRRNVMAAAWVMPIDFEPCKLVASRECVVHAPTTAQVELTNAVGTRSGGDGDKFAPLGITTEPASVVGAPLVAGCAAWLECRVLDEPGVQERYDMFVLECVAAWADDALFDGRQWRFTGDGPRTIHHEKGGVFYATGERVAATR